MKREGGRGRKREREGESERKRERERESRTWLLVRQVPWHLLVI